MKVVFSWVKKEEENNEKYIFQRKKEILDQFFFKMIPFELSKNDKKESFACPSLPALLSLWPSEHEGYVLLKFIYLYFFLTYFSIISFNHTPLMSHHIYI